jgi:hypothetical protein
MSSAIFRQTQQFASGFCVLCRPVAMAVLISLTLLELRAQIPEGFELVRLTGLALHDMPDLSNGSDVIWSEAIPPSTADIYMFTRGLVRRVSADAPYDVHPRMNNHGDFAYASGPDFFGPFDIVASINGAITNFDVTEAIDAWPSMNDSGQVVWPDRFARDASDVQIFLFNGIAIQQITDNGLSNQDPEINNLGQIVIASYDSSEEGFPSTILLYENGILSALTDNLLQRSTPEINDMGVIVWQERPLTGGPTSLVVWEEGVPQVFLQGELARPYVNNHGDMTYMQWNDKLQLWETWLYRSSDALSLKMPDAGLSASGAPINDCRELAWRAIDLQTGHSAIMFLRRVAPKGDFDHNCRIDAYDFAIFQNCFTGSDKGPLDGLLADCTRADFDDDSDVDQADIDVFMAAASGPGQILAGCSESCK